MKLKALERIKLCGLLHWRLKFNIAAEQIVIMLPSFTCSLLKKQLDNSKLGSTQFYWHKFYLLRALKEELMLTPCTSRNWVPKVIFFLFQETNAAQPAARGMNKSLHCFVPVLALQWEQRSGYQVLWGSDAVKFYVRKPFPHGRFCEIISLVDNTLIFSVKTFPYPLGLLLTQPAKPQW